MKTNFVTSLALGLLLVTSLSASDLTLNDGRVFTDASILSQTPRTVVIRHNDGLTSVSKLQLPRDLQARFPLDEAAAREADLRAAQAHTRALELRKLELERLALLRAERQAAAAHQAELAAREAAARREAAQAAAQANAPRTYSHFNYESPVYRSPYDHIHRERARWAPPPCPPVVYRAEQVEERHPIRTTERRTVTVYRPVDVWPETPVPARKTRSAIRP